MNKSRYAVFYVDKGKITCDVFDNYNDAHSHFRMEFDENQERVLAEIVKGSILLWDGNLKLHSGY